MSKEQRYFASGHTKGKHEYTQKNRADGQTPLVSNTWAWKWTNCKPRHPSQWTEWPGRCKFTSAGGETFAN